MGNLTLTHLGSVDFAPLGHLQRVIWDPPGDGDGGVITLSLNDSLRSLHGLEQLTTYTSLSVTDDAALESLAGLAGPPQLRDLSLIGLGTDFERPVIMSQNLYEVGKQRTARYHLVPGWLHRCRTGRDLGQPHVALDLHALSHTNGLLLTNSPQLRDVQMPGLARVGRLEIRNNPRLSTASFANLPAESRSMTGNADSAE